MPQKPPIHDSENVHNHKDSKNLYSIKDPEKVYSYSKKNKPNGHYLVYEIWEDKHPDQVAAGQKLDSFHPDILSMESLAKYLKNIQIRIRAGSGMASWWLIMRS